ncbi:hypothetical protein [Capnocytophaga sp. G2]|uniref:energy transducer TonB n=1 Tax=Capnocytophaga sp. G2 TaxID=3110695 RepID=UPI002B45A5B9|nr:hypothetical protein [Capnocytophaga sp. G2]MEB3005417.1 hypothetical protein [Capnocytophaga sp. G2]
MKKISLLTSLLVLFSYLGKAQVKDTIPQMSIEEEEVDDVVVCCFPSGERKPMFVQCKEVSTSKRDACFYYFFSQYFQQRTQTKCYKELDGQAIILFSVEKDGSVRLIKCLTSSSYIRKEVQHSMDHFPKLIPAQQRGKPVRYFYCCKITFN